MKFKCRFALFLATILVTFSVFGKEFKFPDQTRVDSQELQKHGTGTNTYMFFDVYNAVLYAPQKKLKESDLILTIRPLVIDMCFQRDVNADDMQKAWEFYLNENEKILKLKPKTNWSTYLQQIPEMKKNECMKHVFKENVFEVYKNNKKIFEMTDVQFAKVLIATWIGPKTVTKALKQGLLGQ